MPLPSAKSSSLNKAKKTPMNYEIPGTKKYLYGISNVYNVTPNHANNPANISDAKASKGESKQPEVENLKKSKESHSSPSSSFTFPGEMESSREENRKIPKISSFDRGKNTDFDVGEPSKFQHLTIDFTPIKGVDDNEQLQQKCIDFWKFVNTEPRLMKIMAVPVKKKHYDEMLCNVENNINNQNIPKEKTAVEWTEHLPVNYLGKLSYKYCPEPFPNYKHGSEKTSEASESSLNLPKSTIWTMKRKKEVTPKKKLKPATLRASEDIQKVCAEMEEFNRRHPRSFDPPARSPTLIAAKMQRFLPSLSCAPLSPD